MRNWIQLGDALRLAFQKLAGIVEEQSSIEDQKKRPEPEGPTS